MCAHSVRILSGVHEWNGTRSRLDLENLFHLYMAIRSATHLSTHNKLIQHFKASSTHTFEAYLNASAILRRKNAIQRSHRSVTCTCLTLLRLLILARQRYLELLGRANIWYILTKVVRKTLRSIWDSCYGSSFCRCYDCYRWNWVRKSRYASLFGFRCCKSSTRWRILRV